MRSLIKINTQPVEGDSTSIAEIDFFKDSSLNIENIEGTALAHAPFISAWPVSS
jgi:hypothetical protein